MAAISSITDLRFGVNSVRTASAQATTGQTDWLRLPPRAKYVLIDYNLTAVAGNTPLVDVTIQGVDPIALNDTYLYALHAAFTQISAAAHLVISIGPGVTGIADDTTTSATGASNAKINDIVPQVLGIKVLNDRTSGDETYTYNLSVDVRSE